MTVCYDSRPDDGGLLAQVVERLVHTEEVSGSSPLQPTTVTWPFLLVSLARDS